jgi:hypothetical protein
MRIERHAMERTGVEVSDPSGLTPWHYAYYCQRRHGVRPRGSDTASTEAPGA